MTIEQALIEGNKQGRKELTEELHHYAENYGNDLHVTDSCEICAVITKRAHERNTGA